MAGRGASCNSTENRSKDGVFEARDDGVVDLDNTPDLAKESTSKAEKSADEESNEGSVVTGALPSHSQAPSPQLGGGSCDA